MKDCVHAKSSRSFGVGLGIVDKDRALRPHVEKTQRVSEDVLIWLAHSDLTRDHNHVEDFVDALTRISIAPTIGKQCHPDTGVLKVLDEVEHYLFRFHIGEQRRQ